MGDLTDRNMPCIVCGHIHSDLRCMTNAPVPQSSKLDGILDKFYILRAASGFDLEEVKRRNKAGESEPELKTALLSLALSCLMERPEYIPGEPATTRASKSGQIFAIDTIERNMRAKFQ